MSDLISKLVLAAPNLLVLYLIVRAFLAEQARRDQLFTEAIGKINAENLVAREESRKVIEKNSEATLKCTETMASMTEVLRGCTVQKANKAV